MKKSFYLIILSFLLQWSVYGQAPATGNILLTNGKVVEGIIDINSFINSAIVTVEDGRQLTYHASMIEEINTVDECDNVLTYRSYDYRSNNFFDRLEKKLFQVLSEGNITLLRRTFEYDVFDASDEYEVEEWYYYAGNKIHRIKRFKRQVLPLMEDYEEDMKVFRERNKIKNLNKEANMFLMVSYYNRISKLEGLTFRY